MARLASNAIYVGFLLGLILGGMMGPWLMLRQPSSVCKEDAKKVPRAQVDALHNELRQLKLRHVNYVRRTLKHIAGPVPPDSGGSFFGSRSRVWSLVFPFPRVPAETGTRYYCVRHNAREAETGTMCDHIVADSRSLPEPAVSLENLDIDFSRRDESYQQRHRVCTVLGSSAMTEYYNYTGALARSDMIFVINAPPRGELPSPYRVTRAYNHVVEHKNGVTDKRYWVPDPILTNYEPFTRPKGMENASVTDTTLYGEKALEQFLRRLKVPYPGKYVSGAGVTLWALHVCDRVQLIGFYGFPTFEHGNMPYTLDARHSKPGLAPNIKEPAHERFMPFYLRLHEIGLVDFIL